jgi:hypothetical protein
LRFIPCDTEQGESGKDLGRTRKMTSRKNSDFVGISDGLKRIEAGEKYMGLSYPTLLKITDDGKDPTAGSDGKGGLLSLYNPKIVSILEASDVGYGKDPERPINSVVNRKRLLLCDGVFATHEIWTSLNITHEHSNFYQQGHELTSNNKIDIGISGGYAQVSLGFRAVSRLEEIDRSKAVIGVVDNKYVWATTELRILETHIYKYFKPLLCVQLDELLDLSRVDGVDELFRKTNYFIHT